MTVRKTGTSVVVTPREQQGEAHKVDGARTAPRTDQDTLEVQKQRAPQTGGAGALRREVAVDDSASGAYFHKIVAPARGDAHGIRAEGRLPEVVLDPKRFSLAGGEQPGASPQDTTRRVLEGAPSLDAAFSQLNDWRTGPTDRPSVYLGGHSGAQEADVGLTWDRVYDEHGRAAFTDLAEGTDRGDPAHRFVFDDKERALKDGAGAVVARGDDDVKRFMIERGLQPSFGFRPYWRVSPSEPGTNNWSTPPISPEKRAAWAERTNHIGEPPPNLYLFPGQSFAMNVRETDKGKLAFDIRDRDSGAHFHVGIKASGFGTSGPATWKRVSSIDQKGREKQDVEPTKSMAIGLVWEKTEVLVGADKKPVAIDALGATLVRGRDLKDPTRANQIFNVDVVDGREIVSIRP